MQDFCYAIAPFISGQRRYYYPLNECRDDFIAAVIIVLLFAALIYAFLRWNKRVEKELTPVVEKLLEDLKTGEEKEKQKSMSSTEEKIEELLKSNKR